MLGLSFRPLMAFLVIGVLVLSAGTALAADRAGKVQEMKGIVLAKAPGMDRRTLTPGATIYDGDRITTGPQASIVIIFEDRTEFTIGPNGSLEIDEFVYNKPGQNNSLLANVMRGSFRFASGQIARRDPENMEVQVQVATIGIRGTHVGGAVKGRKAEVVLLESKDGRRSTISVSNKAGSVLIDKPNWGTTVDGPNKAPTPPRKWEMDRVRGVMQGIRAGVTTGIRAAPRLGTR